MYLMGKNQHVVPTNGKWGIRGEGNSKLTSIFDTQAAAIARAREISRNQQSELFIHGRDGRIRERDSHGNDLMDNDYLIRICQGDVNLLDIYAFNEVEIYRHLYFWQIH